KRLRGLEDLADLGLPLPRTRLQSLKRLVIRLCWVFLHRQVDYNHETVRTMDGLVAELAGVSKASAAQARAVDEVRQHVDQIGALWAHRHHDELGLVEEVL